MRRSRMDAAQAGLELAKNEVEQSPIANSRNGFRSIFMLGALLLLQFCWAGFVRGQEISFARPSPSHSLRVDAPQITRWTAGAYEVLHLQGGIAIVQDQLRLTSQEAILWVQIPDQITSGDSDLYKVIVFLDGDIEVAIPTRTADGRVQENRIVDQSWLGRLFTTGTVDLSSPTRELESGVPELYERANKALEQGWTSSVQQAQFESGSGATTLINPQTGELQTLAPEPVSDLNAVPFRTPGVRQNTQPAPAGRSLPPTTVDFSARDASVGLNGVRKTNPDNPNEIIFMATGGVRVAVDSPEISQLEAFRKDQQRQISIMANNVVAWTTTQPDGTESSEIYLEGNVVFSKGERVIYADRMYYNANLRQGTILNAEVLTPAQKYNGLVRLKADVIQQVDENNMQAYGAAFTSSRIGVPRYWLQSENMLLTQREIQSVDPNTNGPVVDPYSGLVQTENEYFVESNSNRVYVSNVPVFFWPRFRANLNDPAIFIDRYKIGSDQIFGTQIQTGWNMYQLLGYRNPPQGTRWTGLLDYLSERGVGYGSEYTYQRDSFFGVPGQASGMYKSWFIDDSGVDFLGRGRGNITPEEQFRGRTVMQHRQRFAEGYQLKAELGWVSDRNFLEQYFEREWDTYKDQTTGIWLERNVGTQSFNLIADYQINDFFTQTSWLPKVDHYVLGQPVFGDRFVLHSHSHAGYGRIRSAEAPLSAKELAKFDPLAWEADVDGFRAGTRHELDFPTQIGPTKVVPYVLGDVTYWQEALDGNDLVRGYGQAGVRASLPFWRVDPTIQSTLWNVNGLAHKVTFDVDAFFSEASQDLDELALYDPLDDDSQEDFRRRFAFDTFGIMAGGDTPLRFDERYFALRSGMQSYVTSPNTEIADDLASIKFGVRQRWQTKRGAPGNERIIDWITLDVQTIMFPKADRDNFGADYGLMDYDFRWHVGDRFTFVSDGFFDFFSQGLRTASAGMHFGRPAVGNLYLGYRMIEGPISSNIVTASAVYRMSEKWGVKGLSQVDFGEAGTIGQSLSFVYIGESFLMQFGVNADFARDNVGFRFGFEPRFLRRSRLFNPGGVGVGPAGAKWLE